MQAGEIAGAEVAAMWHEGHAIGLGERNDLAHLGYAADLGDTRLRDIDAFLKAGNHQGTWPQPLAESMSGALLTRRSGPIVAVTSGSLPAATAHKLLSQVNYQADIVWNNPAGYISEGSKVARLILGIFALTGILGAAALLLGLFLGGGRALYRVLRGKPASAFQEETEFIRLNLRD